MQHPELLIIHRINVILNKHKDQETLPISELEDLKDEVKIIIRQEMKRARLYLYSAAPHMDEEEDDSLPPL